METIPLSAFWKRVAGTVLLIGAMLGAILSIGGLVLVWVEVPRVEAKIGGLLNLAGDSLDTTQAGLTLISSSLDQSRQAIQLMESTAADIGSSLDQTVPMVRSTAGLVGDNLTGIITRTQSSISSAQSSAKFVDDTLNLINSLPLIGQHSGTSSSLSQSLSDVSKSLDSLPTSFAGLKDNLNTSADNLQKIHDRVVTLSAEIKQMDSSVSGAQTVVQRYQAQVSQLQADAVRARQDYPVWVQVGKWGATIFFIWLAAAQVGLALQGLEMFLGGKTAQSSAELQMSPSAAAGRGGDGNGAD